MRTTFKLASLITAAIWLSGCDSHDQSQQQQPRPPAAVTYMTVANHSQAIQMELPGRTRAFVEAEVRPQVSGIILERSFTEGGMVKEGQSLYQIDDATYKAALIAAQADLKRAQANLTSTRATAKRYKELLNKRGISQQDYDLAQAAYLEAQASVAAAKASINNAEINLTYTKVEAPISGVIGKSNVTSGALVTANQGQPLAQISQLDPINIDIVQSSNQLLNVKKRIASGQLEQPQTTAVTLILDDGTVYAHEGKLQFAEVTVNENTGSVTMRAEFPNPEGLLLPGMFVRAVLTVGTDPDAIVVPQKTVTRNPKGQGIVMVINANNIVEPRIVETGESIGNQWLILSGLKAGDRVIVDGLQKVRPGAPVTPTSVNDAPAETSQKAAQ
ncbi:Multidrug efflux pump subunit AcrA [Vibrio stylophorae]|uniref:Multidrug efflux pump subunit AcrA n=1 Tax=Vibrio stylophorae TaxID=659351 RepID=A0ABN8DYN6_9VIBR|nr:efflux RND transporter periplasmic adaptor subunit [Vibrio stylophorae]CAH0535672.1 Multidrug efflux pump subunit AcrA [Vibrio stylophorae]